MAHNIKKIIKGKKPRWFQEMGDAIRDKENPNIEDMELNPFMLKEAKEEELQSGTWVLTRKGIIGRVKKAKEKEVTLSHWIVEENVIKEKCRGCVEHTATRMTTGVINKRISDVTILVVNRKRKIYSNLADINEVFKRRKKKEEGTDADETRKIEIQERNGIRSDYQENEKRKKRRNLPNSANTKHRSINNVESRKRNMANGREADINNISNINSIYDAKSKTEVGKYKTNENGIDKREFGPLDIRSKNNVGIEKNKNRDKSRQKRRKTSGSDRKKEKGEKAIPISIITRKDVLTTEGKKDKGKTLKFANTLIKKIHENIWKKNRVLINSLAAIEGNPEEIPE
ncbi:5992_t:CDS:2 [Gigaspora margarita]|uniref:5992_t:CDS:1 n=1 Tax=Gigaspora margarita TaxID=4874 RepID=A0ABN7VJD5_GIGMA|nr:5992_t:CDS:2 [Gigaspora margarita]